jgi:hypothetical protein
VKKHKKSVLVFLTIFKKKLFFFGSSSHFKILKISDFPLQNLKIKDAEENVFQKWKK